MAVYVVGFTGEYLGSQVSDIWYDRSDDESPNFDKWHYDKINNTQAYWHYFTCRKEADEVFFKLIRYLRNERGMEELPVGCLDEYQKVYARAMKNYPEIMI